MREFAQFVKEITEERVERSIDSGSWLMAIGTAAGADVQTVSLRALAKMGAYGLARRMALPFLGSLVGPLGFAAGAAAGAAWTALEIRQLMNRVAAESNARDVEHLAARIVQARRMFSEFQVLREEAPEEVENHLRTMFQALVHDQELLR